MNEHLPYEDDLFKQLNDLPIPNEDIAWEDMRRRLEKDGDDGPALPPLLSGCGGYSLLLLALIVIAFLYIADPAGWFSGSTKKEVVDAVASQNKKVPVNDKIISAKRSAEHTENGKIIRDGLPVNKGDSTSGQKFDNSSRQPGEKPGMEKKILPGNEDKQKQNIPMHQKDRSSAIRVIKGPVGSERNIVINNKPGKSLIKKTGGRLTSRITGNPETDSLAADPTNVSTIEKHSDDAGDSVDILIKVKPAADSTARKKVDTTADNKNDKENVTPKNHLHFSAGLAIHQLLPVAGQKSNPYNSLGRKSSWGDYVPSVYVRMYKNEKWFVQTEFRYGAAQYTRDIVFHQKVIDTGSSSLISEKSSIKKTFYHQVPLSFNYFIVPNLSIGTGITINRFKSALVQQDVLQTSNLTQQDSLVSTGLVNQNKADSNFVTTYIQALIEAQYKWRGFSVGARYSRGLQPYLKFKLPGGEERAEKNSSLQLFIRYDFWRSRKK